MPTLPHRHATPPANGSAARPITRGWVMNLGWRYDIMVWLFDALVFRGRLRAIQRQTVELARLRPGERVLDVGCGTGTLALMAWERVGDAGRVAGVDPGPRQLARARAKAARRGASMDARLGVIERLPFADRSFDVVFSTMMMHHLPDDLKRDGLREIARVLEPGGRLVVVDFKRAEGAPGRAARLGAGELAIQDLPALLETAGFSEIERGEFGLPRFPGVHGVGFAVGRRVPARDGRAPAQAG